MLRKFTFLALAVLLCISANAQKCGFDKIHAKLMATDPAYAAHVQQMKTNVANFIQNNSNALIVNTLNGPVYEIPVVIHVMHTGGAVGSNYNPSTAQLTGMIAYLNQSYAATWPAYPSASTGGTYIPLRFVLAQRDPNCQPTTGIVRVDASSNSTYVANGITSDPGIMPGEDEAVIKAMSIWPNDQYYNVWIVNKIEGEDGFSSTSSFTAGYAYFPGAPATLDGTVMLAYSAQAGEITLTHEVGHAFNVYHTFEGDNNGTSCPSNTNCSVDGDEVCDTDPHIRSLFNCPSGTNPCTGNSYGTVVHNFMDYSSCQDRFTPGQKNRIIAALLTDPSRASLISSLGGTAIGATPTAANCIPAGITNTSGNHGPRTIQVSDASLTYMNVSSSGYTGDGNQYYIDNTCKHLLDITAGNTYNFSVGTGGGASKVKVFVDYNNDGIFQTNEEIYNHTGTQFAETHSFQYAVPTVLTEPSLISCTPLRMRVIADNATTPAVTACGQLDNGQAEDYTIIIRGGGPAAGSVSVALTQGTNPSCPGAPLTFTATPGTGISNATYTWYVNNINTGITTNTYSSSTLADNDVVKVKIKYVGPCGLDSAFSTNFTVHKGNFAAAVNIAVTTGTNPGCANQNLTFTATPVNGGTVPSYQWKVNGGNVGTNSNTFSSVLNNNDIVTCDLVSNSSCAVPNIATSNAITIAHITLTANITINASTNLVCAGTPITFTSNLTDGGNNPLYQWYVNNLPVPSATGSTFTTSTLQNNDAVSAVYTATDVCVTNATDTSNSIVMGIAPVDTPMVSVMITQGSNPGCLDSMVEFTATVTHHGTNPTAEWYVNGVLTGTGLVFSTNSLLNGDVVTFTSTATDGSCYTQNIVNINNTMALYSTPPPPVISLIGNMLVANATGNVQWYGPHGLIDGATSPTYHPDTTGAYYAKANNNGCYSPASNELVVSLLGVNDYDLSQLNIYPNPTKGLITLDWGATAATVKISVFNITGQGLLYEEVNNQNKKILDLTHLLNGMYYVVIRDAFGKKATVPVIVNKNQ